MPTTDLPTPPAVGAGRQQSPQNRHLTEDCSRNLAAASRFTKPNYVGSTKTSHSTSHTAFVGRRLDC